MRLGFHEYLSLDLLVLVAVGLLAPKIHLYKFVECACKIRIPKKHKKILYESYRSERFTIRL